LPEIASADKQDALSAKGFALGYIGSLLILIISLILVQVIADDSNRGFYTRLCFLLTGLWWWGFAQFSFSRLPKNRVLSVTEQRHHAQKSLLSLLTDGYTELSKTVNELLRSKRIKWFLTSFFFYSVGMQTIFIIATFIGTEIHLSQTKMILTIMLLQIEAIVGALSFAWLVKKIGNNLGLSLAVIIWIVICLMIYRLVNLSMHTNLNLETEFFVTAGLVGLVMGGLQSVSRSTYSKLLPTSHDSSTFFSFYDVLEKCAIVVGTSVHGTLINRTGNTQTSALALALFFVIALVCLMRLRKYERKQPNTSK
jgi:UMF1 family MFS transporter